jgi:hypothetical protein
MSFRADWTREQLLVAFKLYCQMPFGKMHSRNPDIVKYAELIGRTPSSLAMKLTNIASLDPAITSTGRKGLSGASVADKAMWNEMQEDWHIFALELRRVEENISIPTDDVVVPDQAPHFNTLPDYTGVNRTVETTARVGQQFFRRSVLSAYNYRCCITGLAMPELLIASHIIPWQKDETNRLNPSNGLCLSALHDKAFDIGIITIAEDMTVHVSRSYVSNEDEFFMSALVSYDGKKITLPEKFFPQPEFLAYHRERVFEAKNNP